MSNLIKKSVARPFIVSGLRGGTVGGDWWNNPTIAQEAGGTGAAFMQGVSTVGPAPGGGTMVTNLTAMYYATQATAQALAAKYGGSVSASQVGGNTQYFVNIGGVSYNAGQLAMQDARGDVMLAVINPSGGSGGNNAPPPNKQTTQPDNTLGNYAVPPSVQSSGASSTQGSTQSTSSTQSQAGGGFMGMDSTTLLMLGGAAVVLMMMMGKRK